MLLVIVEMVLLQAPCVLGGGVLAAGARLSHYTLAIFFSVDIDSIQVSCC